MLLPPMRRLDDGPFTAKQAEDRGVPRPLLMELLDSGRIRRVLHGVYVKSEVEDTVETRAAAAMLAMRPFGIFCDRTAAWIHGVDTFSFRELEILPPLEVFVLRDRARIRRVGCAGGERDLLDIDVMQIGKARVTTPLRTAMDLGCRLPRMEALAALDRFMRYCGVTKEDLYAELPRYRRRRGVVQLRQLIPHADPRAESTGESMTRLAIIDDGLPPPVLQHWVQHRGQRKFRLDLAYPHHRVAIEYDGEDYHSTDDQRASDESRREWLRQHGWTVIVVTRQDLSRGSSAHWLSQLREALADR